MKRLARALLAGGLLAAASMWIAPPAGAQIPELPSQLDPVLEVIGPVASAGCGELGTAFQLAPLLYSTYFGMPLPSDLLTLLGPVIVVCGSLPPLSPGQRLKCGPDQTTYDLLNLIATTAGQTLPASPPELIAPLGATIFAVQDALPPPTNTLPIAAIAAITLECKPIAANTPSDVNITPSPDDALPINSGEDSLGGGEFALPPDALNPLGLPDASGELPSVALPPSRNPVLRAAGTGFAYPVVFALPLLILVIGGFLGRALTAPVSPSTRAPRD